MVQTVKVNKEQPKPNTPKPMMRKRPSTSFMPLLRLSCSTWMEKRNADEPLVLGRLFAAAIKTTSRALRSCTNLTSCLGLSEQGFAVEGMLE
jgi:hypothetical protein